MFAASVATVPAHARDASPSRRAPRLGKGHDRPRRVIARASSDETPRASPAEITSSRTSTRAAGLAAGVSANDEPRAPAASCSPGRRFPFDQVARRGSPSVPRASSPLKHTGNPGALARHQGGAGAVERRYREGRRRRTARLALLRWRISRRPSPPAVTTFESAPRRAATVRASSHGGRRCARGLCGATRYSSSRRCAASGGSRAT